jgi:hypothetical protein
MGTIPYWARHLASNFAARLVRNLGIDPAAPIKPELGEQSYPNHTNSLNINQNPASINSLIPAKRHDLDALDIDSTKYS